MVFHTEAMAAVDEQRCVAPYACGPLGAELARLWMPTTDYHQESLSQIVDFMTARGRLTLPAVLLREPDGARPNQVAVAAGGIRVGRLPDEVAAEVAAPLVELKNKGWLAVGELTFVTAAPDASNADPVGLGAADGVASGAGPLGAARTIGCRVRLPNLTDLATTIPPRT